MDSVKGVTPKVVKSDAQWREQLSPQEYAVLRQAGTEPPGTGEYEHTKTAGVYECRACGAELFRSDHKFESHCGWPSFFTPLAGDAVLLREDRSMFSKRVEVLCATCHSHLGHVFEGEGYQTPTDQRYCITRSRCGWCLSKLCPKSALRQRHDQLGDRHPGTGEERHLLADVAARPAGP
jgi:peptide-methionine (R)-S-oxide reductase